MPDIENIKEEGFMEHVPDNKEEVNENVSQEQIIEQPETLDQKSEISESEIENMEVHHHPEVEKKNLKE